MASTPAGGPKPSTRTLVVVVAVLILLLAAVIATSFLGNPWYAIVHIGFYAFVVFAVAVQLRDCLRLAKSPAHASKLKAVGVWLALTVLVVVTHITDMLRSDNKDYIRVATDLGVYIALMISLELVKLLLREAPSPAAEERASGSAGT